MKEPLKGGRYENGGCSEAKKKSEKKELEREYTADAPEIKHTEEVRCIAVIKQNASDQEAGEHKEEIDSAPGEARTAEAIEDDALRLDDLAVEVMVNEHEENRNSPHAVELSYSLQDARGLNATQDHRPLTNGEPCCPPELFCDN